MNPIWLGMETCIILPSTIQKGSIDTVYSVEPDFDDSSVVTLQPDSNYPAPTRVNVAPASIKLTVPNNLVLAIDVSNRMKAEDKLPLLKRSLLQLIPAFRQEDVVSVVSFSSGHRILLNGVPGNTRGFILDKLRRLQVDSLDGTTSAPIETALDVANYHLSTRKQPFNNLVMLFTDSERPIEFTRRTLKNYQRHGVKLFVYNYTRGAKDLQKQLNQDHHQYGRRIPHHQPYQH